MKRNPPADAVPAARRQPAAHGHHRRLIFFGLFSIRSPVSLRTDQESASAAVLAQAKAALIGYAAT